jgi:hypothetical protein
MILKRSNARPDPGDLNPAEARLVLDAFDVYAGEVLVYGRSLPWDVLTEVQVVKAARYSGLAGWLVRNVIHGEDRYHVGLYTTLREYVLPNVTLAIARYVVETIAYHAPAPVHYRGIADISPLIVASPDTET